jgi:hypothetical protein
MSLLACYTPIKAQPPRLAPVKLVVFENNLTFVQREGKVRFQNRKIALEDVPQALYGTFWLSPLGDFTISRITFGPDTVQVEQEAKNFFDVLKANVGAKATVSYRVGNEIETAVGEVLPFATYTELVSILQVNQSTVFIRKDQIQQVEITGKGKLRFYDKMVDNATTVELDKDIREPVALQMVYFEKGITWRPSYYVKLRDDTSAFFTVNCLVDNRAENFTNAELFLIRGKPNLKFEGQLDAGTKSAFERLPNNSGRAPVNPETPTTTVSSPELEPPVTGAGDPEGFLVYSAGRVSLSKNSRAYIPVFRQRVSSSRSNFCQIPMLTDPNKAEAPPTYAGEVYESVRFNNVTGGPLLSGSVFVVNDVNSPLGQDEMPFTPENSEVIVRTARMNQVQVTVNETVQERRDNAKKVDNVSYSRTQMRGTIVIKNLQATQVSVTLSKQLMGDVGKQGNAEVVRSGEKDAVNQNVRVTWRAVIAPNGTATIPYEYSVYGTGR